MQHLQDKVVLVTGVCSASKAAVAFHTEILYHENINSGVKFACVCPPPG